MELTINIEGGKIVEHKGFYLENNSLVCSKSFRNKILNVNHLIFERKIEQLVKNCDNVEYWVSRQTLYIDKINKLTEGELKQAFECLVKTYKQMEQYLTNIELTEKI